MKTIRGDIYYADLSPVVGSEQGGVRPVLIIQNDVGNRHSPTTIVAAITSSYTKTKLPMHVYIGPGSGLPRRSVALLEQVRTLDRKRLGRRIGSLAPKDLAKIDRALAISCGLNPYYK